MPDRRRGPTYTVVLQALPDGVPPAVRLKQWLKSALRAATFRALSVKEATPPLPPRPGPPN